MSEDDVQYKLRLPAELHRALSDKAKANGRSLSSEIVGRLEQSLNSNFSPAAMSPGLLAELERLFDNKLGQLAHIDTGKGMRIQHLKTTKQVKP